MKCQIIIPILNRLEMTKSCLESICRNAEAGSYEFILIDNGSSFETKDFLNRFKSSRSDVVLLRNEGNMGWVKAVNQGLKISSAPYVCIMNNDTLVRTPGWLSKMISVAESEDDIGLVNPVFETKISYPKSIYVEVDFCRGYCVLIKRGVIDKVGLLDESYGLGYCDDDDYSIRAIRAGFRCVMANHVSVEHLRDSTFSDLFDNKKRQALHDENKKLLYARWGNRLRMLFVMVKETDKSSISDLLFSLARKQHTVYIWNAAAPLCLLHINIREKNLPRFILTLLMPIAVYLSKTKKASKRYNLIFTDNGHVASLFSSAGFKAYSLNRKDYTEVIKIADSESGSA